MDVASTKIPPPEAPDSPDAWYAPDVRAQYEVRPGVVVTIIDGERQYWIHPDVKARGLPLALP